MSKKNKKPTPSVFEPLSIYPNPTTGIFTVEIEDLQQNTTIELINGIGQTIHQSIIKDCSSRCMHQIDLSDFSNGLYFVKIISNNHIEYRKLILNK